ncbi:putative serine/threonine protein kinase [Tunisvirus fontaine2]|uniref:Putative serine/threonine protein kinase n=1 Tax=Tunisvirus fontaine2 TaxID=1421067 RepID=V9SGI8_9VIRU|nr:putative serine/threonine protein kinase [Tunisvirus fontaine2]AHC55004.1 putative serine/threonine protein kinase [Tunisvirus fontaine2]
MKSIIKVEAEGKVHIFRGRDDVDVQCKVDAWVDSKVQLLHPKEGKREHIKISRTYGEEELPLEVEFYERLEGTELTPKLWRYGTFFSFRAIYEETGLDFYQKFYYIALEKYGMSLEEVYGSSSICMRSSTKMLRDEELFDRVFPPEKFPEEVRSSIRELAKCLEEEGVDHLDFHAGNILTDNHGILKAIDFECAAMVDKRRK